MELYEKQLDDELHELKLAEDKLKNEMREKDSLYRYVYIHYSIEKTSQQKIIHDLRVDYGNLNKDISEYKQKASDKITEELRVAAKVTKSILEYKIEPALILPSILHRKSENNKTRNEMIQSGMTDAKYDLEKEFTDMKLLYDQRMDYLKSQLDDLSVKKRDDLERHAIQFERYLNVKKYI